MADILIELVLSLFDAMMDVITLGGWSRSRGDVIPNITKVKKGGA